MSAIVAALWARLGNCMFVWAHAKKRAENEGHELHTQPWVGEKIFTLDSHKCERPDGTEVETLSGYFQAQKDLIYTRADCRRWFTLRPEVLRVLRADPSLHPEGVVAHFRRGDYAGAGYPLISRMAVMTAVMTFVQQYLPSGKLIEDISDEHPVSHPAFEGDLSALPDFYRMTMAPFLFRANSTFSYWAGVLGHGRVFAPIITGLAGGVEHDNVPYVEGNWPKCADGLDFVTDLHLRET